MICLEDDLSQHVFSHGKRQTHTMNTQGNQDVEMAVNFIEQRAPRFHSAFGAPSRLNQMTMEYEPEEIHDLRETLEYHWRAGKYVDFTTDLKSCTWDDVHGELARAQAAADESARRGKQIHRKIWRSIGSTSSVLAPGLAAIPDELNILHGGLALVFSVRRVLIRRRRRTDLDNSLRATAR